MIETLIISPQLAAFPLLHSLPEPGSERCKARPVRLEPNLPQIYPAIQPHRVKIFRSRTE
jgi:hypothetical protein